MNLLAIVVAFFAGAAACFLTLTNIVEWLNHRGQEKGILRAPVFKTVEKFRGSTEVTLDLVEEAPAGAVVGVVLKTSAIDRSLTDGIMHHARMTPKTYKVFVTWEMLFKEELPERRALPDSST